MSAASHTFASNNTDGCRWMLATSLATDNADSVLGCLEACNEYSLIELGNARHGKWPSMDDNYTKADKADEYLCDFLWQSGCTVASPNLSTIAMTSAATLGSRRVVTLLLSDSTVDITFSDHLTFREASRNGHCGIVTLLLDNPRVDHLACGYQSLIHACHNKRPKMLKLLMSDRRIDASISDNELIRSSSEMGHAEMVKIILTDPRIDPSSQRGYAIRGASKNGHIDVVKLLLADQRVDPSVRDQAALENAAKKNHVEIVQMLLAHPRVKLTRRIMQKMCVERWGVPIVSGMVLEMLLSTQSQFWPRLINNVDIENAGEALQEALEKIQIKSSFVMLLCVKRFFSPAVAARVGDVLREVCSEWIFAKRWY